MDIDDSSFLRALRCDIVREYLLSVTRNKLEIGSFVLPAPENGAMVYSDVDDSAGVSVALRVITGARTIADDAYEVKSGEDLITQPLWHDSVYVGPFARYSFSWRASTVRDEVLTSLSQRSLPAALHLRTVHFLLGMLHLQHLSESSPWTLSGGEAQRLALLLALINHGKTIVVDHALSEQDRRHSRLLEIFLERLSTLLGVGVLHRRASQELRMADDELRLHEPTGSLLVSQNVQIWVAGKLLCSTARLRIGRASITLLVGENGAGKTLMCRHLIGQLPSGLRSTGEIIWHDGFRARRAYVGQDVTLGFSHPTVSEELLAVSLEALEIFSRCPGASGDDLCSSPFELTSDKQKLLSVSKALGSRSSVVVIDEPSEFWNNNQLKYIRRVFEASCASDVSIVIATHDRRIIEWGYPGVLLERPASHTSNTKAPPNPVPRPIRSIAPAGSEYMYRAWQVLHKNWPKSTLELFENWHDHVDSLITRMIEDLKPIVGATRLLDIGCGNGLQTLWLRSQLLKAGIGIESSLAVDWQEEAIEWAKYWGEHVSCVEFKVAEIEELLQSQAAMCSFGLISSLFVLHDIPFIDQHFVHVFNALPAGGAYLACLLNPEWVSARAHTLLGNVDVPVEHDADFARDYLLPEAEGGLGLPYFHRSVRRYLDSLRTSGFQDVRVEFGSQKDGASLSNADAQTIAVLAFKPR